MRTLSYYVSSILLHTKIVCPPNKKNKKFVKKKQCNNTHGKTKLIGENYKKKICNSSMTSTYKMII